MIRKAEFSDLPAITDLALKLWPGHDREELARDLMQIMEKPGAAFFLAEGGFAQCQLRHD